MVEESNKRKVTSASYVLKKSKATECNSLKSLVCKFQVGLNFRLQGAELFLLLTAKSRWWHLTQDTSVNSSPSDCYLTYSQRHNISNPERLRHLKFDSASKHRVSPWLSEAIKVQKSYKEGFCVVCTVIS